jgi:hypothetical protein
MALIDVAVEVSSGGVTSKTVLDRAQKWFGVVSEMMTDGMLGAVFDCKWQ